ncbi:unnamed protein product [Rotaria sp. Silwood2]|nr:unnamed protein product [Rotaria sp. Silwood2]CAF4533712.1 unnamed protein product [Rotaria sp. Silwood2]CAF4609895.1 unnamed protein product [Rotaria sp. Silwood2]
MSIGADSIGNDPFTIVLFGACNSGKSSLINAVMTKDQCPVGHDGKPTTMKLQLIQSGTKVYIDTPGLPKSPSKIRRSTFPRDQHPSMIWLVVNFQAAIEDDEFDILNQFPVVPSIVILNKVDFCTKEDVENFDNVDYSTKHTKLATVHKRLIAEKEVHKNIQHIAIISLKDESDSERCPIGVDMLETITKKYTGQEKVNNAPSGEESSVSIAIVGYSSSGKSSMINTILSDKPAAIGCDGKLTTKELTCYQLRQCKLWDFPAINKRFEEDQKDILTIDENVQPDMIWFIFNYNSVDVDDEYKLYELLKINKDIPVIVIINKVDKLRKVRDLSQADLMEFSQLLPSSKLSSNKKLTQLRDGIYGAWSKLMNLKAVTVTSLTSGDDEEDESSTPIGIDVLLDITRQHLTNNGQKRTVQMLELPNSSSVRMMNKQTASK